MLRLPILMLLAAPVLGGCAAPPDLGPPPAIPAAAPAAWPKLVPNAQITKDGNALRAVALPAGDAALAGRAAALRRRAAALEAPVLVKSQKDRLDQALPPPSPES